jgi:hypothetical protein
MITREESRINYEPGSAVYADPGFLFSKTEETEMPDTAKYDLSYLRRLSTGEHIFGESLYDRQGQEELKETIPREQPKQKAKPRSIVEEIGSSVGYGLDVVGEAMAGTAEMIGIPGAGKVRQYYKERAEMPERARPDYLKEGTVLEHQIGRAHV